MNIYFHHIYDHCVACRLFHSITSFSVQSTDPFPSIPLFRMYALSSHILLHPFHSIPIISSLHVLLCALPVAGREEQIQSLYSECQRHKEEKERYRNPHLCIDQNTPCTILHSVRILPNDLACDSYEMLNSLSNKLSHL